MSADWVATYRLQLHAGFTLTDAQRILPYLAELGISHVYLSPCLQAGPGSQHGYDVTDPSRISADLGGDPAWSAFVACAHEKRLRILLDIVPNHMSASEHNPWWDDVLAHGPNSEFADYFDFRMRSGEASGGASEGDPPFCVHVCSLAQSYGAALQAGELQLTLAGEVPRLKHYENSWPLNPESWGTLLADQSSCFDALRRARAASNCAERLRAAYKEQREAALAILADARRRGSLQDALKRVNTDPEALDAILRLQYYMLHSWRRAGELTNYRRFFDVGGLSGVRTELPQVFAASHARIEAMIAQGEIDGLRVDHPDGLRAPREYFERLRAALPDGRIYVEKILDNDERLVDDWPINGTVGYEFLAKVNRLWMDDQRTDVLTATYSDFTGHSVDVGKLIREMKRRIVNSTFSADYERLAAAVVRLARSDWRTRDLSPHQLSEALARFIVAMPVYRTYRSAQTLHEQDKRVFVDAVQGARGSSPDLDGATFDFLCTLFTKPELGSAEASFVAELQQLTPAVMAKGVEDTTFYVFDRLVSCNEVGSQASIVGISADKFHEFCHYLSDRWPDNLLATSTHDNKRSEDVRTRISILSEIPDRWAEALHRWSNLTAPAWQSRVPDRHAEYLLYQTLIGAWPIGADRCWQYMLKACREAKINTSWHEPNSGYEEKIHGFVDGVFQTPEFIASLEQFVEPLILPGRINSLAQTLIKMVAPGVPDFYQGTELWELSLVDPDNRRPVDYALRAELLSRAWQMDAADVLREWDSGLPKLWMTLQILALRRQHLDLFSAQSKYQPLVAQGSRLGRLLAFRRGENLIAVTPRFSLSLAGDWADTVLPLPGGEWRNCFTQQRVQREVPPAELFSQFPVALLMREPS